jgi:hypothetical protein
MTVRMRMMMLALMTLAVLAPTAEAARRDERGREAPGRSAQRVVAKPEAPKAAPAAQARAATPSRQVAQASRAPSRQVTAQARGGRTARQAEPRFADLRHGDVRTSRSGLVVRGAAAATVSRDAMASCTQRNGRTVCGGGGLRATSSIAGWQSGLPMVNYAQRECPEGTFATLARGHDDVVRCMPM